MDAAAINASNRAPMSKEVELSIGFCQVFVELHSRFGRHIVQRGHINCHFIGMNCAREQR